MSKTIFSTLAFSLLALCSFGQTIVSTTPENKNVILEEFTGIHCQYCPQGHAISEGIQAANPGDVFLINVHVGGYAVPGPGQPDFRTPFGAALDNQAIVPGYPAGTVNRVYFPALSMGGGTAMGRNQWESASNQILAQSSYLNVGVEASLDVQTRELTVHVEVYYTGDSPEATNLLNVALLQNNTLGPQTGGNMGNEYVHMHRLVYLLTGQWGQTISNTAAGSFIDETFTYTLPADYNGVPAEIADMEIVAFVSETHQDIISGFGTFPTLTGITDANDANVVSVEELPEVCIPVVAPQVVIGNSGSNNLTSLDIEYSINNGTPQTFTWTGDLNPFQSATVELPEISYTLQETNTLTISLPDDEDLDNNILNVDFEEAIHSTGAVELFLFTDQWGTECTWNIMDSSGAILYEGGPYGANETVQIDFELPEDCITFNLYDSYGDGGDAVYLTDSDGTQLFYSNGSYGSGATKQFASNGILGVKSTALQGIEIYPNPASSYLSITNVDNASIYIYNMLGQRVASQDHISSDERINVSQLQTGTYFIKMTTENGSKTEKLLITE